MEILDFIDVEEFKISLESAKKYFRINTLKIKEEEFREKSSLKFKNTVIGFVKELEERILLGSTAEYFLGLIHPQSLSSAIVPLALDVREEDVVLDVTASPGSKTTEIAMLMNNKGAIVANDRRERLSPLFHNIARLGVVNTVVISTDAKKPVKEGYFTKVLLDAPCSALGSHLNSWKRFEEGIAKNLSRVQKRMILSAFDSLKEGGTLVYSTCTITKEENENVVDFLLQSRENAKLDNISLDVPHEKGLSEYGREFRKVMRIYPKHLGSEGFFIAKIKKV